MTQQANGDLVARLHERLGWLERQMLMAAQADHVDLAYERAQRAAFAGCVECWLFALEHGERWSAAAPTAVMIHARKAAEGGVGISGLLQGYMAGRDLLWRATLEEVDCAESAELVRVLRQGWVAMESLFARVLDAVEEAYDQELAQQARSPRERHADLVRRLLRGENSLDLDAIPYDLRGWHLGLIACGGERSRRALAVLAERVGSTLYALPEQDGIITAWLGVGRELQLAELEQYLPADRYPDLTVAVGRSGQGVDGFCLSHRQALEAFTVAEHRPARITLHAEVELDALLLRDQEFAALLVATYITPLEPVVQKTLLTSCNENWNESAAARVLGVTRNTVRDRLQRAEIAIGKPIGASRFSIELAIRANELLIQPTTYIAQIADSD